MDEATTRHLGPEGYMAHRPIAAVITICTHRKRVRPSTVATAVSLPIASQAAVQSAWLEKVRTVATGSSCERALCGPRISALRFKRQISPRPNSISSPLGWGWWPPPSGCRYMGLRYRADVSVCRGKGHRRIRRGRLVLRTADRSLFQTMVRSGRPFRADPPRAHSPICRDGGNEPGRIGFVDLGMIANLWCISLARPAGGPRPALAPYDKRLDAILPGTRADFSQRALIHLSIPSPEGTTHKTATTIMPLWSPPLKVWCHPTGCTARAGRTKRFSN